jgi:hypothetical protein
MEFYVNANSQEWIHDISTRPDTTFETFFQGGPFVATTVLGDTLVGRYYSANDQHILAQQRLYLNSFYSDFWVEATWAATIHKLNPPMNVKWWWFDILHQTVFFKPAASDDLKHTVIKFFDVYRHGQPPWWPSQPAFTGYEETYIGMMMDIDCPFDTLRGQNARNAAGWDATNNIAWMHGSHNQTGGNHTQYDNYYAGMALIKGQFSENEIPWGTYNLCNDTHLYPQNPWGWLDGDFYQVAKGSTLGAIEFPDSLKDRSQVVTAKKITAGNNPNLEASFTVVEAIGEDGLAQLQTRVAAARTWVTGLKNRTRPFHYLCGDVSGDGIITVSDVVLIINYLFKNAGQASLAPPLGRADISGTDPTVTVTVSDAVLMLGYLFKAASPMSTFNCPTVW